MFAIKRVSEYGHDWLELWKDEDSEKWYQGYLSEMISPRTGIGHHHRRTLFESYDYAESVAIIMSSHWKGLEFVVISLGQPIIHPEE